MAIAVLAGRCDAVKALLRAGADAAAPQGGYGLTPLMLAACGSDDRIFAAILRAQPTTAKALDAAEYSAAQWALHFGQWRRTARLHARGCQQSSGEDAAKHCNSISRLQPRASAQHSVRLLRNRRISTQGPDKCRASLPMLPADAMHKALVAALQLRCPSDSPCPGRALLAGSNSLGTTGTVKAQSKKRRQTHRRQQQTSVQQLLQVERADRGVRLRPAMHAAAHDLTDFAPDAAVACLPAQGPWTTEDMRRKWARCMRIMR